MRMVVIALMAACVVFTGQAPADAQSRHSDQNAAREARQAGRILPLREIQRRVLPQMPDAQYLGFDFEPPTATYTLKFLREGAVIWVDVDGRSGHILRRTGG
ncbi:hypothetical protein KY084_03845 [Stakelama sp. CBK3Z-3]|uniref:PepSY domain-containing protein n=1 Tax=Stakelama flava TaxID=2860338 RepID=A0ABS6XJC5_9SPHN|nr:hypothetical protein [Stakelama flava]MBW4330004.1 hypothetical protein [Stakelama flava]